MNNDSKLLEIFLASTIHEAKNYLGHLADSIEQLLSTHTDTPLDLASVARGQVQNLNHLLTQVLVHYRGVHAGYQLHTEQIDLEDYFEELSLRHQPTISAKNASLTLTIKTERAAFFDEQLINNVIDTLIANALSAGATKLTLVAEHQQDHQLKLQLTDNGPGFPPHLLTEDLSTVQAEHTEDNKTGLGLYLANQILQAHQNKSVSGSLQLSNSPTGGANVCLYIP